MKMPNLYFESEGANGCYVWGRCNGYEVDDDPERIQTPFLNIKIYMPNEDDDNRTHLMTIKGRLCFANELEGESLFEVCDLASADLTHAVEGLDDSDISTMYYVDSYELFEKGIDLDFLNDIFPLLFDYIHYTEHIEILAITLIEDPEDWSDVPSFPIGIPECFYKSDLPMVYCMTEY